MFDVAPTEFLLVVVVALVVIGPKDLPKAMRFVGKWVGKARGMARHFRSGLDTMMREAELDEMQKQWAKQNEEIMRATPALVSDDWMGVTDTPAAETPASEPFSVADESARAAAVAEAEVEPAPKPVKPRAKAKPKTDAKTAAAAKPAPKRRAKAAEA